MFFITQFAVAKEDPINSAERNKQKGVEVILKV